MKATTHFLGILVAGKISTLNISRLFGSRYKKLQQEQGRRLLRNTISCVLLM
jgi:hypothetical protein